MAYLKRKKGHSTANSRTMNPSKALSEGKDKAVYVGHFKNGKFDGKGKITLPDGTKMEGEFKEGELVVKK